MSTKHPTTPPTNEQFKITPQPDADACGATGCRETTDLVAVPHPTRGKRVLCPDHATDYLNDAEVNAR